MHRRKKDLKVKMETLWKRSLCYRHSVGFLKRSPQHRLEREAHTQSTCFVARRGSQRLTRQQRHPTPLPRTIKEQCQSCRQQSSSLRRRQRSLLQAADFVSSGVSNCCRESGSQESSSAENQRGADIRKLVMTFVF